MTPAELLCFLIGHKARGICPRCGRRAAFILLARLTEPDAGEGTDPRGEAVTVPDGTYWSAVATPEHYYQYRERYCEDCGGSVEGTERWCSSCWTRHEPEHWHHRCDIPACNCGRCHTCGAAVQPEGGPE